MTPRPRQVRAREELAGALEALDGIGVIAAGGQDGFNASLDRRRHAAYLWIVAGSRLKNYCDVMGISRATGELAQAISFRHLLAYRRPSFVDFGVVWRSSVEDAPSLHRVIEEISATLDGS